MGSVQAWKPCTPPFLVSFLDPEPFDPVEITAVRGQHREAEGEGRRRDHQVARSHRLPLTGLGRPEAGVDPCHDNVEGEDREDLQDLLDESLPLNAPRLGIGLRFLSDSRSIFMVTSSL